jgi:hypothetical protein
VIATIFRLLWPLDGARLFGSPMLLLGSDPKAQRRLEFLDRPEDGDPSPYETPFLRRFPTREASRPLDLDQGRASKFALSY